jgi:hypothetical protein
MHETLVWLLMLLAFWSIFILAALVFIVALAGKLNVWIGLMALTFGSIVTIALDSMLIYVYVPIRNVAVYGADWTYPVFASLAWVIVTLMIFITMAIIAYFTDGKKVVL